MNSSLFDTINELAGHSAIADDFMRAAAHYLILAISGAVAIHWVVGRRRERAANQTMVAGAVMAVLLGLAATSLIQHLYVHARPFVERQDVVLLMSHRPDASLPSEHTVVAFALAGAVLWSRRLLLGSGLLLAAIVLGLARIYAGLHYPADIVAGVGIGLLTSFLAAGLAQPFILRLRTGLGFALPRTILTVLLLD